MYWLKYSIWLHSLAFLLLVGLFAPDAQGSPIACTSFHIDAKKDRRIQDTHIVIHYMYFLADTYTPVTLQNFKDDTYEINCATAKDKNILYSILERTENKGTLVQNGIRLVVEDSSRKSPIFVDQEGNVMDQGKQYSLRPIDFVRLDHLISYLLDKQFKQNKHGNSGQKIRGPKTSFSIRL